MHLHQAKDQQDDAGRLPRVSNAPSCNRLQTPGVPPINSCCRIPIMFIDVNAVPGNIVYDNGIRVSL